MRLVLVALVAVLTPACVARNYTHYLIDVPVKKNPTLQEEGTLSRPFGFGSTTTMKVRWNDGALMTEVEVPLLASGQRVVIEHGAGSGEVKTLPATRLVPPPPTRADESLIQAYRERGLSVDDSAAEVSLTRARTMVHDAMKEGNYQLALEWCELVLARYKSHPEFLRAKASILLMLGEKEKAVQIYEQAEEIETDPQVRKKLEELQRQKK